MTMLYMIVIYSAVSIELVNKFLRSILLNFFGNQVGQNIMLHFPIRLLNCYLYSSPIKKIMLNCYLYHFT